jgi:hypothetical protein
MVQDALLKSFEEFEIKDSEKSKIMGGVVINGCRQNGSTSYIDYYVVGLGQICDYELNRSDDSGWCAALL